MVSRNRSAWLGIALFLSLLPSSGESAVTCRVWVDDQGIPHADAGASEDAAWGCLGYLHGSYRAWQMDYLRRVVRGRTAEILGTGQIREDFTLRLLGLVEKADALWAAASPRFRARLEAYSAGVNHGMKEAVDRGSYELTRFHYVPEEWKPGDSIAVLLLQAFNQTQDAFQAQLEQVEMESRFGEEAEKLSSQDRLPWDTSILKPGEFGSSGGSAASSVGTRAVAELTTARAAADLFSPLKGGPRSYTGSNNWVAAPSRTRSGLAMLANDPHLELTHPPFWFIAHVHGGPLDVFGASLPGFPQVVSGANRHAAWGLTNSFLNVSRLSWVPEEELHAPGVSVSYRPVIKFGVARFLELPFFLKTFRRTRQGWPILPIEAPQGKAVVLRWSGYDLTAAELDRLVDLGDAQSVEDVDAVMAGGGVPSWNFVFADDRGGIGYRAIGRVPRDARVPEFGIASESLVGSGDLAFPQILSPEEMPHVLRPERGYVVTANNRQWPAGAAQDPGRTQKESFRAFRIEELLKMPGAKAHDVESFRRLQCDQQSVEARFILPQLLRRASAMPDTEWGGDARVPAALRVLRSWNFEMGLGCRACALWRRWADRLYEESGLGPNGLYRRLADEGPLSPALAQQLGEALRAALADLKTVAPTTPKAGDEWLPRWGDVHHAEFSHLAGERWFRKAPIATPGDDDSVDPGSSRWRPDAGTFDHFAGASQRMVVELSSPPRIYSLLAGSEEDLEHPDLNRPGGPWKRWEGCELDRRNFPIDFSQVPAHEVKF